jgi:soluble lytic murein transglycosylase
LAASLARFSPFGKDIGQFMRIIKTAFGISRLVIASALLLPVAASAAELTPEQRAWYRAQLGLDGAPVPMPPPNSVGDALVEWRKLDANEFASFEQLSSFLITNPGWPGADKLRARAEKAIPLDQADSGRVLGYFASNAPRSPGGMLRHALALNLAGQRDAANSAARAAWTSGALDELEEARLLSAFPGLLTGADHDARMDRLLLTGATRAAARQLPRTSPGAQPAFAARLAMRNKAADAGARAAGVEAADPAIVRRDAGYIADKATWLRGAGRVGEARALLAAPRQLAAPPADAEEWLETLLTNARGAASGGDPVTAFNIARQIEDAFPAGTVIRTLPLSVRDDYTSLAWLAAHTANRTLGRPGDAVRLYRLYAEGARSAQTRTKGFYWAGRAAEAAGQRDEAQRNFTDAATHYDQFYGQLARERLGLPITRPAVPPVAVSEAERSAFAEDRLARGARVLGEVGAWREQSLFLRAMAQRASTPADHALAGELGSAMGRIDLGVMIGRSAIANNIDSVAVGGFPTMRVPDGHQNNWTFIHAITRQESQFDKQAISHAGARGLMQLMPGTAREVSAKLGLIYDLPGLTANTGYNIQLGSTYFQQMLNYYGGSYPLAVAAYNAGPGNVNKWLRANGDPRGGDRDIIDWIEAIPIFETRNYVHRVLENAVVYDLLHPEQGRQLPAAPLSFYLGKRTPG